MEIAMWKPIIIIYLFWRYTGQVSVEPFSEKTEEQNWAIQY